MSPSDLPFRTTASDAGQRAAAIRWSGRVVIHNTDATVATWIEPDKVSRFTPACTCVLMFVLGEHRRMAAVGGQCGDLPGGDRVH
jgi:hypothetical protein